MIPLDHSVTGRQIAAARAMADVSQATLAAAANISIPTLKRMEASDGPAVGMKNNVAAVVSALRAAGVEFIDDERGEGVLKLRLPVRQAATEAEMQASADDVRSQAAVAVDEVLSGSDATAQQKAERRGALTDEPAVIARARGKGRGTRV